MADSVGNLNGPRGTFEYVKDDLEVVSFSQDDSVGKAVGNAVATTNRSPIPINTKYLQGRYILLQAVSDPRIRKKVIIGNPANPLMTASAATLVTINSRQYVLTGRSGEQASFLRLTPPAPAPD